MPQRRVPPHTRRLTRDEAQRLGVSHAAKRRVSTNVKNVTRSTKTYTDREAHTAKVRARELKTARTPAEKAKARKMTREAYTARRVRPYTTTKGKSGIAYRDLSKADFYKFLKRHKGQEIVPQFYAERQKYRVGQPQWSQGTRVLAEEIGDDDDLDTALEAWGFTSEPTRFGFDVVAT